MKKVTNWPICSLVKYLDDPVTDTGHNIVHDAPLGRVHLVERLPRDDDHRGYSHQGRRDPEGQGVAGRIPETFHVLPEDR